MGRPDRYLRLNEGCHTQQQQKQQQQQQQQHSNNRAINSLREDYPINIRRHVLYTDDILSAERASHHRSTSSSTFSCVPSEEIRGGVDGIYTLSGGENRQFDNSTTISKLNSDHRAQHSSLDSGSVDGTSLSTSATEKRAKFHIELPTRTTEDDEMSMPKSTNYSIASNESQSSTSGCFSRLASCVIPDEFDDDGNSPHSNSCTNSIGWRFLTLLLPFLSWLPKYSVKNDAISDLLTGCTIVALHIPQGLAYSQLAGLPPVNGLYVSLFPVVVYALLGGSRQLSVGTFAVVCITCKDVLQSVSKEIAIVGFGASKNASSILPDSSLEIPTEVVYTPVEILTSLAALVGVILLLMGVLRLGVLVALLSEPIISAFVVASSLYVLTSQIFDLIGTKARPATEKAVIPFELLDSWYHFFATIGRTNLYTLGLSTITVSILMSSKKLLEPFIQKKFNLARFALPVELLAIIVVTSISSLLDFSHKYNIVVIPKLNSGFGHMPIAPIPRLWTNGSLITGAFVIAFIVYATSFTLAKLFADNHGYRVNANQELVALGSANLVGSFFLCFPASGSLARSAVQEKVGGKTQLASLVSAGLLVVFLLFLSGYLETLPKCTLASIILVALMNTLKKFYDIVKYWNISKIDCFLWCVTFILVVLFGVGNGLLYALAFNLLVLIVRMAIPKFSIRRPLSDSECYYSMSGSIENQDIQNSCVVFEFHGSLMHLSVDHFQRQFRMKILVPLRKLKSNHNPVRFVIFDAHAVAYIDSKGVDVLKETRNTLQTFDNIQLLISGCNISVSDTLERCSFLQNPQQRRTLFASTIDAVQWAKGYSEL